MEKTSFRDILNAGLNLGKTFVVAKTSEISSKAQNNQNVVNLDTAKINLLEQQKLADIESQKNADSLKKIATISLFSIIGLFCILAFVTKIKHINKI